VGAGDLSPDHTDLGSADLFLALVDICNLLAEVEVGSSHVINTLDLDQRVLRPDSMLVALPAEMTTLDV